jgi:endonuclease
LSSAGWDDHRIRLVRTQRQLRDSLARRLAKYIPGLVRIHKEYPTAYGAADLVAVDRRNVWHVIEVKRGRATVQAGVQLRKYVEALAACGRKVRGYVADPAIAAAYYRAHGYTYLAVRHARQPAASGGRTASARASAG